jgi:hypothetical protein
MPRRWIAAAIAVGCLWVQNQSPGAADQRLPQPDHVVVVVFENHSFEQIIGSGRAIYLQLGSEWRSIRLCFRGRASKPAELFCAVQRLDPRRAR